MAKPTNHTPIDGAQNDPGESNNPPRDLHATSDIRFVMVEVAKLCTLVERLIKDVEGQDSKIDALRHQATYIKGGLAVAIVVLGIFGWFISKLIDGKMQSILTALSDLQQ